LVAARRHTPIAMNGTPMLCRAGRGRMGGEAARPANGKVLSGRGVRKIGFPVGRRARRVWHARCG
jgi:hypothetical protein